LPETFLIPQDFSEFVQKFNNYQKRIVNEPDFMQRRNLWIVKPTNKSCGRGIYIVDNISEVNLDDTAIVSKYIEDPLLINDHKFDLRIYVCVTSYEPLRIYVYKEGLARFASEKYTLIDAKTNLFKHLTNYSINKKNTNFVKNEDVENDDVGFKWSLQAFMKHLRKYKHFDVELMWSRIYDLIIKSILSGENYVYNTVKKLNLHRNNCFEVFGYDVLLDSNFKPWLMEVNLSPSLACDSPLDMEIKAKLMTDTFNLVGVKKFDRKKEHENKAKNRMKSYNNKSRDINKQFNQILNKDPSLNNIFAISNVNSKLQKNGQQMADLYNDDFS
jgi:tubulin polyglutamylase TTLL5